MMDRLELGPVPSDESCQQVGTKDYDAVIARAECNAFRDQIRRVCGNEPDGAKLIVKSNPHDFGSYYEVAVSFDPDNETAVDYAFKVESTDIPNWDDAAKAELTRVYDIYNAPVESVFRLPSIFNMTVGDVLKFKNSR